jgi:signal transduction histidine kinase
MVAISIMPIIVLSYMLYGIKTGLVKMDDPTMHLLIMSILFPVPVIFVGYVVAKTFRDGIMGINDDLKQLGKGNFSIVSMPTSSDDFGLQAYNLNQIIKQLNFMYSEIKDLNINLEHKVNERTAQVNEMLDQLGKLYSDSEDKRKEIEVLAESRKKLSLVGQMAAGIVHDIKNPMATIKSLAEMLNSDSISPQRRTKNLNLIVREMDRLSDLSYEILDFSKGKLNLELKEVNLKEFITEIEQFLKIDFDYANVKCIFDIQYDGNIYIDKDRMRRVFINIAKNAMEAMYDGQKEYSLTIRSELTPFFKGGQGEFIIISFIDNGNGLPKSVEERIFEAFTTEGKNKGTGLGLYMCKWIVESHNGTLTYETKQGEGTTFFVSLPVGMHGVHPINEELRIKN